jgi:phenylacetate-CoA ligase
MFLREAAYVPVTMARQYGSRAALRRYQLRQLNAMLAHASQAVAHYRDDPAYRRGPLRDVADLGSLPLVTKAMLRAEGSRRFVADGVDTADCLEYSTSGTTGHRVVGWHDEHHHDYHMATCARRFFATRRYLPTDRLAHVKPFPMPVRSVERFGLFRRHVIRSTQPCRAWIEELLAYRPRVLVGYPVHLRELLRTITDDELTRLRRSLRLVMTESELLVPERRAALERGFGMPVFDEYSAWETLNVYFECHRGGRHIAEDRVCVEVIDGEGRPVPDGAEGQIVVTAFRERAMPLIRYAMGDIGVVQAARCRCGRRFRTLVLTSGRLNDCVILPDGTKIFGDVFQAVTMTHPGIDEMVVRQDAGGAIRVSVVPDGTLPVPRVLADVRRVLLERAGFEFDFAVDTTEHVPLTAGGKGQVVQSEYAPAQAVNRVRA